MSVLRKMPVRGVNKEETPQQLLVVGAFVLVTV
ncbi:hypothetical protein PJIAN_4493 [Paludibacter jiangxiensis]|uniref:Uncharacterized protein n=1 Tax=Paludibacter jiangxiensis TaxID=681398 RepID=A0A161LSX0_9BACT|nr:hypothetical protein PJIAN_4493 [Paludibacter jiangxiensis]